MKEFDTVVIGAGPAGLAAGYTAAKYGAKTLILERAGRPGGILKQCIHDGFGLYKFGTTMTGPEYTEKYINLVGEEQVALLLSTFVTKVSYQDKHFYLSLVNSQEGVFKIKTSSIVLANGCRERTSRQIFMHGSRPAGIYTAGTAQYFVNVQGYLPCKRCIILGSGDIGLIMARRLTLEGAEVIAVYEIQSRTAGLNRNIIQCLEDFQIPLHLNHTISKVFGRERVEAVELIQVDKKLQPIRGTEKTVSCDGIILSVGLIPENETAEMLDVRLDPRTGGPFVDQFLMTDTPGIFSCGNALHVNDLVDYVSESGELAGQSAALYSKNRAEQMINLNQEPDKVSNNIQPKQVQIKYDSSQFQYFVPQYLSLPITGLLNSPEELDFHSFSSRKNCIFYFRVKDVFQNKKLQVKVNGELCFSQNYQSLFPPEMKRVELNLSQLNYISDIYFKLEEGQ